MLALGVCFDTVDWRWWVREDKLAKILSLLQKVTNGEKMTKDSIQSINGRIIDLSFLVRGGRYNMVHLLRAAMQLEHDPKPLTPSNLLREQCEWRSIRLQASFFSSPITNPDLTRTATALQAWTDAAGGCDKAFGAGVGGVIPPFVYFYQPWPAWLNNHRKNSSGDVFSSKLSCLELLGPLITISVIPEMVVEQHLVVYVDNQGSCDIYRKGYSTKCLYAACIAKACFDVAEGLGATMSVEKIRRCSDWGSLAADTLSKGKMAEFREMMPGRDKIPATIPQTIIDWLKDPTQDWKLGSKIVLEIKKENECI